MKQRFERKSAARPSWTTTWLSGLIVGAATMYLADPDRGRRRRALAKDKINRVAIRSRNAFDVASRDLANRTRGIGAQAQHLVSRRHVDNDDAIVRERVRSRIGRVATHPHAISVIAQQGRVILSGPILAHEKKDLLAAVRKVPGVSSVEDNLSMHETPDGISALQGQGRSGASRSIVKSSWPPGIRAIAAFGGSLLSLYAMTRHSSAKMLLTAAGLGLLARSTVNRPLISTSDDASTYIHLNKTIHLAVAPETVFDIWSQFENYPHFMSNVKEVKDLGNGRSHWVVRGPAGTTMEWNAVLTKSERPVCLAWRSEPGSPVQQTGEIHFEPELTGTRVSVHISYRPPAGALGHIVASLFGKDPKHQMDQDLMRMKAFIEEGVPPRDAAQPLRGHAEHSRPVLH